jgi:hypothetical protein
MKTLILAVLLCSITAAGQAKTSTSSGGWTWGGNGGSGTMSTSATANYSNCDSITASYTGGWKPIATAPKTGVTVEVLQTYGIAPWYGLFKWNKDTNMWQDAIDPRKGVGEECAFWRPTQSTPTTYREPTGGAQNSVEYWCRAAHRPYNKKKDACD